MRRAWKFLTPICGHEERDWFDSNLLLRTEPTGWSLDAVGEASGLATITTLAYSLWDLAMRKGNLLLVAACSYFTPLLSTLVSCAYLRVSPSPKLWLGCLLLVSGSLVTWRSVSERPLDVGLLA